MIKVRLKPKQGIKVDTKTTYLYDPSVLVDINQAVTDATEQADRAKAEADKAEGIVAGFDEHAAQLKNDFDVNAATLTARFDNNYLALTNAFNKNAEDKTNDFNLNATGKTEAYNSNATEVTNAFNANAMQKIDDFDSLARESETRFNQNASEKTTAFNTNASEKQALVDDSASKAKQSELNAKESETNAKNSENASGISEDNARESERLARLSKEAAATSEDNAAMSASDADLSAQAAKTSEDNAKASEDNATTSEFNAGESEQKAKDSADLAKLSELAAKASEEECKRLFETLGTIFVYKGSVPTYNSLPITGNKNGDVYRVIDQSVFYVWVDTEWQSLGGLIDVSSLMTLNTDQEVTSSKTFTKSQAIKSPLLDPIVDRNEGGNSLVFTGKDGNQIGGIQPYINNNGANELRFVASNGTTQSAFAGLGITKDGQGFFEIPVPADTSDNNDAVSSSWVNKKTKALQTEISTGLGKKQDNLSAEQTNAVNSGITSTKVATYDGYKAIIDGKQPVGNYQTTGNLAQTIDASAAKYPSNKAVATALSNYLPLSGGTLTGNLSGKYLTGTWLQTTSAANLPSAATKIAVIDGSGWLYYRTPEQIKGDLNIDISGKANTSLDNITQAGIDVIKKNSGGGVAIGSIFSAPYDAFTPEGAVLCDGAEYASTQFPEFFANFIQGGKVQTVTYAQFSQELAEKGFCRKFGVNGNNFKVPYLTFDVAGKTAGVKGYGKTLGLSDGSKNYGLKFRKDVDSLTCDIVYYDKLTGSVYGGGAFPSSNDIALGITTDPTKSGMVAELPHEPVKYYVQLANGSVNESMFDYSKYMQGLEGKANKDLSNATPTQTFIDSSISWNNPSDETVVYDCANNANTEKIAPFDGFANFYGTGTQNAQSVVQLVSFKDNGENLMVTRHDTYTGGQEISVWLPCRKGQKIKAYVARVNSTRKLTFIKKGDK